MNDAINIEIANSVALRMGDFVAMVNSCDSHKVETSRSLGSFHVSRHVFHSKSLNSISRVVKSQPRRILIQ